MPWLSFSAPSPEAREHIDGEARRQDGAAQVHVHYPGGLLGVDVRPVDLPFRDRRVVDQDVQAPEVLLGLAEETAQLLQLREVRRHDQGFGSRQLHQVCGRAGARHIDVRNDHGTCTRLCQRHRGGTAEAAARTGHDGHLIPDLHGATPCLPALMKAPKIREPAPSRSNPWRT
jgi:hypothetical protein